MSLRPLWRHYQASQPRASNPPLTPLISATVSSPAAHCVPQATFWQHHNLKNILFKFNFFILRPIYKFNFLIFNFKNVMKAG
jgi:hypothetical protein